MRRDETSHEHPAGNGPDVVETPQAGTPAGEETTSDNEPPRLEEPNNEPDDDDSASFDREYVTKLRDEAAQHRRRARDEARRADELARSLFRAHVLADGSLADPDDLEVRPELATDPDAIRQAIAELLEAKPHLRTRRARGDVGQGQGSATGGVSLTALLRRGA